MPKSSVPDNVVINSGIESTFFVNPCFPPNVLITLNEEVTILTFCFDAYDWRGNCHYRQTGCIMVSLKGIIISFCKGGVLVEKSLIGGSSSDCCGRMSVVEWKTMCLVRIHRRRTRTSNQASHGSWTGSSCKLQL